MEPLIGSTMLWTSFIMAVLSLLTVFFSIFNKKSRINRLASFFTAGCFISMTATLILLAEAFLSSNFDVMIVWENTSREMETLYRISAIWSNMRGSVFLWTYFIIGIFLIFSIKEKIASENNRTFDNERQKRYFHLVFLIIFCGLLLLSVIKDPFARSYSVESVSADGTLLTLSVEDVPEGFGLKSVLKNPWMMIHPPIVFVSYSLIIISFSISISSLGVEDERWMDRIDKLTGISWFLLTSGISMGAIWAYTVVIWGGYWSWDPKEISALMVWIILTFHIYQMKDRRSGSFRRKETILASVTAFAIMIGGLLFTMAGILDSVPLIIRDDLLFKRLFVTVISTCVMVILFLWLKKVYSKKNYKKQKKNIFFSTLDLINPMVFLIIFILLSVLLRSLRGSVGIEFTEILIMVPTLIILISLNIILLGPGNPNKMISIVFISVTIPFLSVLLFYLDPADGSEKHDLFSGTSAAILVISHVFFTFTILLISTIKKLAVTKQIKFKSISIFLFIIGISLIIVGYSFGNTWNEEETLYMESDRSYELWEKEVSIADMEYNSMENRRTLDIELESFDDTGKNVSWEYDAYRDEETSTSHIKRGIFSDTIIFIEDIDPDNNGLIDTIEITFKRIPMTNLVWTGILLMLSGTALSYVGEKIIKQNPDPNSYPARSREKSEKKNSGVNE